MSATCRACRHPRRDELDAAIVAREPLRDLAARFNGLTKSCLHRHRSHVGQAIVRAAERKGERQEESLLEKINRLEADARRLGERAEKEGDLRCALAAVKELLDVARLMREVQPYTGLTPAQLAAMSDEELDAALVAAGVPLEAFDEPIVGRRVTVPRPEPAALPAPTVSEAPAPTSGPRRIGPKEWEL